MALEVHQQQFKRGHELVLHNYDDAFSPISCLGILCMNIQREDIWPDGALIRILMCLAVSLFLILIWSSHRIIQSQNGLVRRDFQALPVPIPCHGVIATHTIKLPRAPSNLALSTFDVPCWLLFSKFHIYI